MSATSEYETAARQDYGPTTSSENIYEHVLDHKLTETEMSVPIVRPPVLRATPISPTQGDPEPDSTNPESIIQSVHNIADKEVEFHISENKCDSKMSLDTVSGVVRIEEATMDSAGRIAYPIIQETDDSSDYVDTPATLIQAPLNTTIVQNVTKLPQNFTINVDAAVGNITTIQNLSQDVSGSQTLWLPTILATSAPTDNKNEDDRSQPGVSQIIITSDSYVNDISQLGRRANIVTDPSYINRPKSSKVQILSNIPIPKNSNYPQPYIANAKDLPSPVYGTQNHVYKLSTNVVPQKHVNNSVLCTKQSKSQSLIGCSNMSPTMVNNSPMKNVSYSHTFSKTTNLNKTLNKVNNGANLNAMVAASSGNTQCHILSRVVSGPNKMSVHSGRKSVNTLKAAKNSNSVSNQKNQSRAIKIIQQTGSVHKSEGKTWPVASVATYKSQQPIYGVVDSNTSKIIQKVGSPPHKSQQTMPVSKFPAKGERLVLQSPCGPVLISTAPISTSLPKGPHYVQSGSTPNLRYVQTYGSSEQLHTVSQVSANQQLTAQILQSLSQPKLMFQPNPGTVNHALVPPAPLAVIEEMEMKPVNQKRIVFGDKTTLLTADDIIGMEERPNLTEEFRRYTFQALAFVMLDHTYALPGQKLSPTIPTTTAPTPTPVIMSPTQITSPMSPVKRTSPVIMSTANYELPVSTAPMTIVGPAVPVTTVQMGALTYKPQVPPPPQDDDAASVMSSLDGDRRPPAQGGSDTETAPEGEDEGKTRCICDFTHDDGYMICCDRCGEWQHVDCMGIDRNNIPDSYMCDLCQPRPVDRRHARAIQMRKREELSALGGSDSDSSEQARMPGQRRKRLLTVTTYTNTSGSSVTTYNSNLPVLPPAPQPSLTLPKRGPKRPKKAEVVRKGTKRKLSEKRVKRKKEMMMNRNKYNSNMSSQAHWQDSFEQAMTNHYSPELRAKIMKYSSRLGNTPNMASAITAHLCTTVPHAGGKILIATKDLKDLNTPIIELRGKYMLSNQHRPQLQNSARAGSQKPGPFVFFYRLPKDNTQICIDTRTYGNEARFVRRSCKPNAELQHCIVKGALHVYLVTIAVIPSNTEITVGHDSNGAKQPCACGNPKHCKVNGFTSLMTRKSIDYPTREKRSRNRCSSSSSPASPPPAPVTPIKEQLPPFPIKSEKKSPIKHELPPLSPVKHAAQVALNFEEPMKAEVTEIKTEIDLQTKEEMKPEIDEPDFVKVEPPPPPVPSPPPHIEEPIEPKLEPVKPEPEPVIATPEIDISNTEVKEVMKQEEPIFSDEEKFEKVEEKKPKEEPKIEDERPATREFTAKSACHDRSSRSSRTATVTNQDSLDDKTDDSQDKIQTNTKEKDKKKMTREERKMEAIMKAFERMEKAEQRKQEVKERQKRRESDPHPNSVDKDDDDDHCASKKRKKRKGRARTTSQSNRRRLNSADSDMVTSGDEGPRSPPPRRLSAPLATPPPPPDTSDTRVIDSHVAEDLGLSSACLLVEAAVGSVESAFKLPKTKKTIATEWLGRSPERTPSPYQSPYRSALVPAPSLESLVRVASTIIGDLSGQDLEHEDDNIQSSPPRTPGRDRSRPPKKAKRITRNTPPAEVPEVTPTIIPQHSAKKRWLRQAISEESDSPTAESPPNEMVTPLKKRRLARESLSCEQNTIVPCNDDTSPVLTSEDSPVKDDLHTVNRQYKVRNIMESLYGRDRTRSDSGQGSDDQCNMDNDILNVNIKGPHDTEHIRRIIGVPTPEEELPPEIPKLDDIKVNNNNLEDESGYKVVPMEIDTTTIPQPKIESNENSNSEIKAIDSPNDKLNSCQSADTSGNSSPQRDEMDDIQKKIHSFHTENILILKSRNKKPPKEKRKKVNLNFDLNMVDDQISIQLRTDDAKSTEVNGESHEAAAAAGEGALDDVAKLVVAPENIPLPPTVESVQLPAPENIPLPAEPSPMPLLPPPEAIPLPEGPMTEPVPVVTPTAAAAAAPVAVPFSSRFSSTGLFSGIFTNMSQSFTVDPPVDENASNMSIIKSVIDRTRSLESSLFDKDSITQADELKSVQEILTRVNNMDSNNSVLLSGVLKSSNKSSLLPISSPKPAAKPYCPRSNDPRLNPPPVEKPKPVRRKLSITEYRKRHLCGSGGGGGAGSGGGGGGAGGADESSQGGSSGAGSPGSTGGLEARGLGSPGSTPGLERWSRSSSPARGGGLSPATLAAAAAAAADDLELRLHRELSTTDHRPPAGVFSAQPTASERQREKLSSRLRREFGLALPDDDDARHPTDPAAVAESFARCDR